MNGDPWSKVRDLIRAVTLTENGVSIKHTSQVCGWSTQHTKQLLDDADWILGRNNPTTRQTGEPA